MRSAQVVLAITASALLLVAGCARGDKEPQLMNIRSTTNGPDEFGILPPKALQMPENLAALPVPTPGGGTTVTMRFATDPLAHARKQEAAE